MKTEKKLIACSIIAVIIGISSVFPLAFIMSATADTADEPWFSIDMTFGYWVTSNGTLSELDSNYYKVNATDYVNYQHKLGLNTTLNVDTTNEASDGRVEYYKIEVSSDQGLIETLSYIVGTNSNSSFSITNIVDGMHFSSEDWFDTDEFTSGGGTVASNWATGVSELSFLAGSGESTSDESNIALRVTQLREAQTITVTIYRVGWATFTGDSITFTSANNTIVDQIQLEKYGEEGWLYNDLYPEDELVEKGLIQPLSDE